MVGILAYSTYTFFNHGLTTSDTTISNRQIFLSLNGNLFTADQSNFVTKLENDVLCVGNDTYVDWCDCIYYLGISNSCGIGTPMLQLLLYHIFDFRTSDHNLATTGHIEMYRIM